jgi:hypothetical protein
MNRDHDLTFMPFMMFGMINAAILLCEPFSKGAAFHCSQCRLFADLINAVRTNP